MDTHGQIKIGQRKDMFLWIVVRVVKKISSQKYLFKQIKN